MSILLDVFPRLKLYEELVEDMVRQQQQSTGYIEEYSSSSGFK
jgi:cell division FtsZ-interacting protein ZapD